MMRLMACTEQMAFTGTHIGCGRQKVVIESIGTAMDNGIWREMMTLLRPLKIQLVNGKLHRHYKKIYGTFMWVQHHLVSNGLHFHVYLVLQLKLLRCFPLLNRLYFLHLRQVSYRLLCHPQVQQISRVLHYPPLDLL